MLMNDFLLKSEKKSVLPLLCPSNIKKSFFNKVRSYEDSKKKHLPYPTWNAKVTYGSMAMFYMLWKSIEENGISLIT